MKFNIQFFLLLLVAFAACGPELPNEIAAEYEKLPNKLDYNIHVKPILSDRCFACHGNDKEKLKAGLELNDFESATSELAQNPGTYAIVPGKLEKSQFFHRIISTDPEIMMPPPEFNLPLSNKEKAILTKWIEDGAKYKPHWAFEKPVRTKVPEVKDQDWANNTIDKYVLAKLEEKGWSPSPTADKETLLRRITFDLTGLPPTIREIEAFLNDHSDQAYETVVDRLLDSPAYGERMATNWMDLARFADTHGYTVDRYRDMSPWRDWVIKAFNENMPYDRYVTWQLAGDLLPNPKREQILATGFNRNHQQNMEGGIIPEEFRVEYVADRTNTLGTAFLGLTLECARCHDHKYDPISQKEYFETFSFFNSINEAGQISFDNAMPVPTLLLSTEKEDSIKAFINQRILEKSDQVKTVAAELAPDFKQWMSSEKTELASSKDLYEKELIAHYDFENKSLQSRVDNRQTGVMTQMHAKAANLEADFIDGKNGDGIKLDGDAWIDFGRVGVFDMSSTFSIGLWVKLPEKLEKGVIFHKSQGAAIYDFRGFHLSLKNNELEILMAHTAPYNAITQYAANLPREEWIHLMMTYDGSGKASGLKTYLNAELLETRIENDNLYKDILFNFSEEPGLQIGARWRGSGIKGGIVDDVVVYGRELAKLEILQIVDPEKFKAFLKLNESEYTPEDRTELRALFLNQQENIALLKDSLSRLRRSLVRTQDTIQEVMVMAEMDNPRPSFIHERGRYDSYGEEVFPSTINAILPFPDDLPRNRLGLAEWLFQVEHPLTARVAVNRLWQHMFGRGIVKSVDDFGNQGSMPSHPELLDYLALEFMNNGWNIKATLKSMVMSASYRQSSKIQEEKAELDVENVLLWRGPSARLSAEMMRDNALAASELLVNKIGGKSVKPYQPEGLWKINGGKYQRDTGDKLYRRSLYTFWKRSVPLPTQGTFDAPNRSYCTVKRQKTSTPLQALVLLNDPTFIETSKVLGEEMTKFAESKMAITITFKKLTGRNPSEDELSLLLELQHAELKKFKAEPDRMKGILSTGEYEINEALDLELVAANTIVASTIMNADATIIKR